MIQGFDPRTGEPVGEPVAETTDAEVDAAVAAAVAAAPAWAAFPRRAEALEAVADALDARAGELAAIADTETALGGERLTGEVARTTGQLRLFAAVLRDGGYADVGRHPGPGRRAGPAPDRPAGRPGGRVRGVELPVRVLRGRRRHRLGAGRGLPGGGEGARGTPGHLRRDRRDRGRGAGVRRGPGWDVRPDPRRAGRAEAAPAPGHRRGRVHRVDRRRAGPGQDRRRAPGSHPVLRRARLGQPVGGAAGRGVLPSGRDRHRVHRLADARHRPVLHQPRPAVRPRGRGPAVRDRRGGRRLGRRGDADRPDLRRLPGRGGGGGGAPRRHRAGRRASRARARGAPRRGCSS